MPAYSDNTSVLDRQLLLQLGERLKRARMRQGLSTVAMAQRVGISRTTLHAVESGNPTPNMGTYLRVMSALGVSGDLALLASDALQAPDETTGKRAGRGVRVTVAASDAQHALQDLLSLMLHKEAIRLMHHQPELIRKALNTLDSWRSSDIDSRARVLWDEWSVILRRKDWRKALARSRRGNELRQASPLPTILPPEVRQGVLNQVRELKDGVTLGHLSSTPAKDGPTP